MPHVPQVKEKFELPATSFDFVEKIFRSPYYWRITYLGLLEYKTKSGQPFEATSYLSENDEYLSYQPILDKDSWNTFKVAKCEIDKQKETVLLTIKLIEPSAKNKAKETEITYTYKRDDDNKATGTLEGYMDPADSFAIEVGRMIFKQGLHRIQKLFEDSQHYLKEFEISGLIKVNRIEKAHFHDLPYGIETTVFIPKNKQVVLKLLRTNAFIGCLLGMTSQPKEENSLQLNDEFEIQMTNMSLGLNPKQIEEKVVYTVKKSDNESIELVSNTGLANFHQFGCKLEFEGDNNGDATTMNISVYYNRSNLVSIAQGVQTLFANKLPDPSTLLYLRVRNILDFYVRHTQRYVEEKLHVDLAPAEDHFGKTEVATMK